MPTPVRYAVDLSLRLHHLVRVTMTVPEDVAGGARLVLPTWTPGSYVIRNYVHHVQTIEARTATGDPVGIVPDGVTAWRLPDEVDSAVEVTYELYANDLTVRTNHVDDRHALLIPAATFPYVEGATDRPHEVVVDTPEGERTWALLPNDGDRFVAEDFDQLVDSAFETGDLASIGFEVAGVPHEVVWSGPGGRPDLERVAGDAAAIGEAAVELFEGDLPIERYTYLVVGWDTSSGGGGLEHRDGSVVMTPLRTFGDPDRYATFLRTVAHEYLHLWNVKRLVPAELVRPDYERPTHTTSLWVAEGWTDHYDDLLPLRAGVWTLRRFLDAKGDQLQQVEQTPGAALQSVRRASYEAWTKLYVRDENSVNVGVSYYSHGAVLAWALDLLIRGEDPGGDGLDGALRELWRRFGRSPDGYTEQDVETVVVEAAGRDLSRFFADHVDGTELPPTSDLLDVVGLRLVEPEDEPATPWLGAHTQDEDGGVTVTAALRGEPAWTAGVTGGDRLVAIDGETLDAGELQAALRSYTPGDRIELTVARGPRLLQLTAELGEPRPRRRLQPVESPTESQRTAFQRWTSHDLDDA